MSTHKIELRRKYRSTKSFNTCIHTDKVFHKVKFRLQLFRLQIWCFPHSYCVTSSERRCYCVERAGTKDSVMRLVLHRQSCGINSEVSDVRRDTSHDFKKVLESWDSFSEARMNSSLSNFQNGFLGTHNYCVPRVITANIGKRFARSAGGLLH